MKGSLPSSATAPGDYLPEDMLPRQSMINTIVEVFERFGFVPLQTPAHVHSPEHARDHSFVRHAVQEPRGHHEIDQRRVADGREDAYRSRGVGTGRQGRGLDESAGVQTGELVAVTADGAERLHDYERGLLRIG